MTMLGLEYQKLKEQQRHNQMAEATEQHKADSSRMQAETGEYVSSFKPREVAATESQAASSAKQADAAALKAQLDATYRPQELEVQKQNALSNAVTAAAKQEQNTVQREKLAQEMSQYLIDNLPSGYNTAAIAEKLGYGLADQIGMALSQGLDRVMGIAPSLLKLRK